MSDYISREAAIVDFERCNHKNPVWTPQRVKTLLMRIPAADVEPVRHGRWNRPYISWYFPLKIKNPYCFCTYCGQPIKPRKVTNYCPNCGAKMDLEDENHENFSSQA